MVLVPEPIMRRSQVWPAPTTGGTFVLPQNWAPTSEIVEEWGYVRLTIDGVDVTMYRDVPTQIGGWTTSEPFGPESCSIVFPQIAPFEAVPVWIGEGNFTDYKSVLLELVRPDNTTKILWEGFIVSHQDFVEGEDYGLRIECVGTLYQGDFYLTKPPATTIGVRDIGAAIAEQFTTAVHPSLQYPELQGHPPTQPPAAPTPVPVTGINTNKEGSWEPVMTGFVQDLLSTAWFEDGVAPNTYPNQWTIDVLDGIPVLAPKDLTTITWNVRCATPGVEHDLSIDRSMAFNVYYGEGIRTDNCRWRNLQVPGQPGQLANPPSDDPFFYPLAWSGWVEPIIPGATEWIANPDYDSSRLRIERHEQHGANITRDEADDHSHQTLLLSEFPNVSGTITLSIDPEDGGRFEMRAGHNINFKGYRGNAIVFHINNCEIDLENGTVTLSVDTVGRDHLTWSQIRDRNKENEHPSWQEPRKNRNSKTVEDRFPSWDCEAGAGVIPQQTVTKGAWHVYKITAAGGGSIVQTNIDMDASCRYGLGIFDADPTGILAGNPLADQGAGNPGYWDGYGDSLVIAWGQFEQAAGYYPGTESDGDAATGDFVDDASWYYESQTPPYLWLAIYVEGSGTVTMTGQLKQGAF